MPVPVALPVTLLGDHVDHREWRITLHRNNLNGPELELPGQQIGALSVPTPVLPLGVRPTFRDSEHEAFPESTDIVAYVYQQPCFPFAEGGFRSVSI
jgi:hypothetical protein